MWTHNKIDDETNTHMAKSRHY